MKASVYLGSRAGDNPSYMENAYLLGKLLAQNGVEVVYGGARVGTMGELARGVMEAGGALTGVFPKGFRGRPEHAGRGYNVALEPGSPRYTFVETPTLDERIHKMEELSDVCIILPGSYGTMHEFFCWMEANELGRFHKKVGILNTNGYYTHLIEQLRVMQSHGFSDAGDVERFIVDAPSVEALVRAILV